MIAFFRPGPSAAAMTMARMIVGNAKTRSAKRMMISSTARPKYPAMAPSVDPITAEQMTTNTAAGSVVCAETIRREKTSLGQGIERGQLLGEDRHEQPDEEDDAADDAQWSAQGLGHAQAATSESTLQEFSGPGRRTRIRGAGGGRLGAGSVGTAAHWTLTLGSTKP